MKTRALHFIVLILTIRTSPTLAQREDFELPSDITYQIESYIENIGEEVNFDFNTLYDRLSQYYQKPLNLNTADENTLENLHLLSPLQINSLLSYRKNHGNLIAIYELQAIPNFDLPTIYRILPFVKTGKGLDDLNISFAQLLEKSKRDLFLRWSRNLEVPNGFKSKEEASTPAYLGDINKYYVRYAQQYENRISLGFTLEKDPGEEFFKGSNNQGFDFMSGHFMYKKVNSVIDRIVLGDFRAQFGQGLILNTGFTPGKNVFVHGIRRTGSKLNRFTSVNEQNYLRGGGIALNLNQSVQLNSFIAYRKRDGNTIQVDTSENDLAIQNFTSLQLSGLHRTEKEISTENTLNQLTLGSSLTYKKGSNNISLNVLYNQFNRNLGNNPKPYNQFYFRDNRLLNLSIDYNYFYKNLIFFGETAWSDNQSLATVNGVTANLHPTVALSFHHRYFPRNFHSLLGQSFSETSGNINEKGLYLGLSLKPSRQWRIVFYVDAWRHPWLRFKADAPSKGREYFARVTYYKRRDMEAYIHWKLERKQQSYRLDGKRVDELLFNRKNNFRFQINKKITKRLELRSRLEWSSFNVENAVDNSKAIFYSGDFIPPTETKSTGFLIYQDILFKPVKIPISLTTRFAIFDIDNYDARIYAYENDVTYQFSIPAYYNKGTRFYANIKYRGKKHLTLEARYAQTYWSNQEFFGSGNNKIEGSTRTAIKLQLRWRF